MTLLNRVLLVLVAVLGVAAVWVHQRALPVGDDAHRPFDFDAEQVTGLEITNDFGVIRFRRVDAEWFAVAPTEFPADTLRLATLVANLESIRTAKVLPRGETPAGDLARAGLDQDTASFAVFVGDRAWRGTIGRPPAIGTRSYLVAAGRVGVFTFVSSLAERFFDPPLAFHDPRAIRCEPALLSGIRIESDGRRLVVREEVSGHWTLVEPHEGPVGPVALDGLLNRVFGLRTHWKDSRPRNAPATPTSSNTLVGEWRDDHERGEDKLLFWSTGTRWCEAYHVGLARYLSVQGAEQLLALRPETLRDTVVLRISDTAVEIVRVRRPGRPPRSFRVVEGSWSEVGGTPGDDAAKTLGELLLGLEHEEIGGCHVPASPADLTARFGRPEGELSLEVVFRGMRGTTRVRFGEPKGDVIRVRRDDEDLLVGVPRQVFEPWIKAFTRD